MKLHIWTLLLIITCIGCKNDQTSEDSNFAYLGGQIINPKSNFVVISKGEKLLDTVKLDGYNKFIYKIDSLDQGLYTFKHGDEFQMVLLEPNDSLLIRLNTIDFDESLVYTGVGAKKNNYFTNEFLQNEIEVKKIFKYCQLEPKAFEKHIESIKTKKNKELQVFKDKYKTSELFNKIAQANIDYNFYHNKEIYPFIHYGKNKSEILASLPNDFYAYRKDVNYNDDFLKDYFTYHSFLRSNINNVGLEMHLKHSAGDHFDRNSVCYTMDKLHLIDSLIANRSIKNDLLYHYTVMFLTKCKKDNYRDATIKSFLAKSDDIEKNDMVKKYAASLKSLKEGNKLPEVAIRNFKDEVFDLNEKLKETTVICFWSHMHINHFKESYYKLKKLRKKYPEVTFLHINIDNYDLETTKKTLKGNNVCSDFEYQFKNPEMAKEVLAIYPITKTIILDKDKKIVESTSNIFDNYFEEQLLGAINR